MIEKLPEHSNIRTIFFIESEPNPAGMYEGNWWVMSWDGAGDSVLDGDFNILGNANFQWGDKGQAQEYLKHLEEICPDAKVEYLFPKEKLSSFVGMLDRRLN